MTKETKIMLFQGNNIRYIWDDELEEYFFSVIDVVGILSGSKNPSQYWRTLKSRINSESNETVTICNKLKMLANDGKMRKTDVATKKQLFRIIQSIPSPNANHSNNG